MICIIDKKDFCFKNTAVTIGKFDGLHIGHKALIERVCCYRTEGLIPVVFRLDIQPSGVSLRSESERIEILKEFGTGIYIKYPFTAKEASVSAEDFIDKVLIEKLGAKAVVVGEDFRFGFNRMGDAGLLERIGKEKCFETTVMKKVASDGEAVSSSHIRELLKAGKITEAEKMLG